MGTHNKYLDEYRNRTETELLQIRSALMGNMSHKNAVARVEAITEILGDADTPKDFGRSEIEGGHLEAPDFKVANGYVLKAKNSAKRGVEFLLTIAEYKRLITAKRCYYTGIVLTQPCGDESRPTDRTIERLDKNIGYVAGNCVACCHAANSIKAVMFESHTGQVMTKRQFAAMAAKMAKLKHLE